jgi:hypothetical protein
MLTFEVVISSPAVPAKTNPGDIIPYPNYIAKGTAKSSTVWTLISVLPKQNGTN